MQEKIHPKYNEVKATLEEFMAMSIKSIPVLKGQDAANFVAEADNNKNQATPVLSEKAAERLKKVLEKSKAFTF